jgi:hypothetical protein
MDKAIIDYLINDPYVVDVVFGLVTLLSLAFFWMLLNLTVSIVFEVSEFVKQKMALRNPNNHLVELTLNQLQSRRSDLCWELDQIEDAIFELMPLNVKVVDSSELKEKEFVSV